MFTLNLNFSVLAVELIFLITGIFFFLVDKFIKNKNYAYYLVFLAILLGFGFLMFTPFGDFTKAYQKDFFSATIQLFLLIGAFLIVLISYTFLQEFRALNYGEFYGLLLFSLIGAFVMVASQDLLTLYLGMELMSIPVYFLIASNFVYGRNSLEGSLKYFIAGALASAFIILGLALVYHSQGSLIFKDIFTNLAQGLNKKELFAALILILAGFSIKLSLVPFHMWAPDAYQASPLPVTTFLAGIVKFALMGAFIKIMILGFSPLRVELGTFLIPIALITVLIGSLLAIKQDNIVRMLAYSSVAHVGYASLGFLSGDYLGYGFILFYMLIYLFTTIGTFGLLIYLASIKREFLEIPSMSGISQKLPLVAFLILVLFFSLAGVPPTAGFMAKFYIFIMLVKGNFIGVAILALLFSVIGAYPYLRVIKVIYMDKPLYDYEKERYSISLFIPIILSLFIVLLFGVYPKPAVDFIQRTLYLYMNMLLFHT
ncbi:MAG: NADH-quinone oxidoreductase subunit N [Caldimicrobium sp.]